MNEAIENIARIGIVPVLKLESAKRLVSLRDALVAGGIPIAEVTFRTEAASDAILAMRAEASEILVGAGTVTSVALAEAAAAGARFIACPAWDEGVVDYCLSSGTPVIPGVSGARRRRAGPRQGLDAIRSFSPPRLPEAWRCSMLSRALSARCASSLPVASTLQISVPMPGADRSSRSAVRGWRAQNWSSG